MDFRKPATRWEEQVDLLHARGMVIPDEGRAQHYLSHINYYRLTGYWLPFEADHDTHQLTPGTTFDSVLNLYLFDREFRLPALAKTYQMDQGMLKQFARHLTYVRNLCAHQSRVWNRKLTVTMPLPRTKPTGLKDNMGTTRPRNIYNTLVMLVHLLSVISPGNYWTERLIALLEKHQIETSKMGFPADWRELPIWRPSA